MSETWLNLGAGRFPAPSPWVNIDVHPSFADVAADVRSLPFADNSVSRVYAGHVAEHLHLSALTAFFDEIRRVLTDDGHVCFVIPDIDLARRMVDRGEADASLLVVIERGVEYGDPGDWETHKWLPRLDTLVDAAVCHFTVTPVQHLRELTAAGWPLVSEVGWQSAVVCT